MPQAGKVTAHRAEARVDLLSAVVARISERELTVRADLRVAQSHETLGDRHVAVLDDEIADAGSPERIPRPQIVAAEAAFDARALERTAHDAVEFAAPAEGDRVRRRPEVRDDAGEELIALLPVGADDVEWHARAHAAPADRSAEGDVGGLGREAAGVERHLVRSVAVRQRAGDRHVRGQRHDGERPPLDALAGGSRGPLGRARGRHDGDAWRRHDGDGALAAMLDELPERPFEDVP